MSQFQHAKALVREFYRELESATPDTVEDILGRYISDSIQWHGVYPFEEQRSVSAVSEVFWQPLLRSWSPLQRREDVFFAGYNDVFEHVDGKEQPWPVDIDQATHQTASGDIWVVSMGHFAGVLSQDWLGLPASGKLTFLRYADFNCVRDGKIVRSGFFCDIIDVMHQLGINPLPVQTGASFVYPGPRTHDGMLFVDQNPEEGVATQELLNRMIDDLNQLNLSGQDFCPPEYLARTWREDMLWYGPAGIGATFGIKGFQAQHQRPFRTGLGGKTFNGHVARFAEGNYAGFFGWPNLSNTPTGGFLGLPASDVKADMRVVDIYRREGDKLAENWVLIDLPYWLKQQGLDILQRTTGIVNPLGTT
jgi:predicted ester cyclase